MQVWQGSADSTVVPSNADAIALQWADLHGIGPRPARTDEVGGYPRRVWTSGSGESLIEHYSITGMAHGIPLDPGTGEDELGEAGAHMLDVGLSSTGHIAAFFGIAPLPAAITKKAPRPRSPKPEPNGVGSAIEKALKAAGLIR